MIDWGPAYRIYLTRAGADLIVLLGAGIKRRQQQDVSTAKMLNQEYRTRKSALKKAGRPRKKR